VRDRGRVEEQAALVQAILKDMEAQSRLAGRGVWPRSSSAAARLH